MLKTRVIGVVVVKDGVAVQSIGFRRYLPVGTPEIAIEYLDRWGIDEIVVLHIDATAQGRCVSASEVASYSARCQVPLAIGGGIAEVGAVKRIIQAGADKVVINAAALAGTTLIEEAAARFGDQCVVVSIDARARADAAHEAWIHSGTKPTGIAAADLAARVAARGAGEILINSIDNDGARRGYDLGLLQSVVDTVELPVIACGGAGHPDHMVAAIGTGVAAVAAANFFHYQEHSVILVKQALLRAGCSVRLDSYATYEQHPLRDDGRLGKHPDRVLDALRFHFVPEEVI